MIEVRAQEPPMQARVTKIKKMRLILNICRIAPKTELEAK